MTRLRYDRKSRPLNGGHGPVIPLADARNETEAAATLSKIKHRAAREKRDASAIERENHIRARMGLPPKEFVL
jgi:hypothetical protein